MSERKRRAYRLVVDIPPECLKPGYVPEVLLEQEGRHRDFEEQPFRWPPRRLYFSPESAARRARKLADWGATVRLEHVELVGWQPTAIGYRHDTAGYAAWFDPRSNPTGETA